MVQVNKSILFAVGGLRVCGIVPHLHHISLLLCLSSVLVLISEIEDLQRLPGWTRRKREPRPSDIFPTDRTIDPRAAGGFGFFARLNSDAGKFDFGGGAVYCEVAFDLAGLDF